MKRTEGLQRLKTFELKISQRDFLVYHFLFRDLQYAIKKYASGKVLDIGCGNKPYKSLFRQVSEEYIGCDIVQSSENRVDVICEATKLPFESATFTSVFTTQVIEHVAETEAMLNEAFRVLKPNGTIIVSAPFAWELHEAPYDFYRFSKYGLKHVLERSGFEVLEILPNGGKWAALFQLFLNVVYTSFHKKSLFVKLQKFLFIHLKAVALVNWLALIIDRNFYDDILTLNYVVVARKP